MNSRFAARVLSLFSRARGARNAGERSAPAARGGTAARSVAGVLERRIDDGPDRIEPAPVRKLVALDGTEFSQDALADLFETLTYTSDTDKFPNESHEFQSKFLEYQDEQGGDPPEPPERTTESDHGMGDGSSPGAIGDESGTDPADERVRPYRPCSYSQSSWRHAVGMELRRLREWKLADAWDSCGRDSFVVKCGACGADPARIAVQIGCGARSCPFCARKAAQATVALYDRAVDHVEALTAKRVARLVPRLERQLEIAIKRRAARAKRMMFLQRLRPECMSAEQVDEFDNLPERLAKARHRVGSLTSQLATLRSWRTWGWKWLTVTIRWNDRDPENYTVEGIRRRACEVQRRVKLLADALKYHGASATISNVESSSNGFVHAHVLHHGPIVNFEHVNRKVFGESWTKDDPKRAGTVVVGAIGERHMGNGKHRSKVSGKQKPGLRQAAGLERAAKASATWAEKVAKTDGKTSNAHAQANKRAEYLALRAGDATAGALRAALTETLKYSLKSPSVLASEWIGGQRRDIVHPTFAARWIMGTKRMQLRRTYGLARTAVKLAKEPKKEHAEHDACPFCDAPLPRWDDTTAWERKRTREVAKAVQDRTRWRMAMYLDKRPSAYAPIKRRADVAS